MAWRPYGRFHTGMVRGAAYTSSNGQELYYTGGANHMPHMCVFGVHVAYPTGYVRTDGPYSAIFGTLSD
jgi:hypothetical protein